MTIIKRIFSFLFVMLMIQSIFIICVVFGEVIPKEIIALSDQARGAVGGVEWQVTIEAMERGKKKTRDLIIKARDFKVFVEYIAPPKVKGRKIMMIDRTMWFTKPGLKKPVPISPRQKLMGNASNGDIASTNYAEDYEAHFVSEERVEGEVCYLFDLISTNKKTTYDRIKYWISKDRLVGVKAEFFTTSGKLFKSATFEYNNSVLIQGQPRVFISKMTIRDAIIKDNVTTMMYNKVALKKIPDSTFNLNLVMR